MAQIRNHKWDKDDSILTLYYVKFGLRNLPVKDEKEFAEWIIGSSVASLTLQSANVRFLLGYEDYVLTDYSADQSWAVEKFNGMSRTQLEIIVNGIIDRRDVKQNIKTAKAKARAKDQKVLKAKFSSESDEKRDAELRRLGFDPSKMKSKGIR